MSQKLYRIVAERKPRRWLGFQLWESAWKALLLDLMLISDAWHSHYAGIQSHILEPTFPFILRITLHFLFPHNSVSSYNSRWRRRQHGLHRCKWAIRHGLNRHVIHLLLWQTVGGGENLVEDLATRHALHLTSNRQGSRDRALHNENRRAG